VQKERSAVSQRELLHGAFEVEVFDLWLPRGRTADHLDERCQPEPRRAPHIPALVSHNCEEPWADRHPRPELVQLAPGTGQRLLRRVLGVPAIPEHREGEPQAGLDQRSEQRLERRLVAGDRLQPEWFVSRQGQCVRHTQ
jgi:hypothetical protein